MTSLPDTCTIDGCDQDRRKRGLCNKHYSKVQRGTLKVEGIDFPPCSELECSGTAYARGLCNNHWARARAAGKFMSSDSRRCTIDECETIHHADGLCSRHYSAKKNATLEKKAYNAAQIKKWRKANPEQWKTISARSYEKNKISRREGSLNYQKNHPEVQERSRRKRRAMERNAFVESFTSSEVVELYGTDCHICLEPIDMKAPRRVGPPGWERGLHVDHVISLAKGGAHSMDNSRPSHGLCNLQKGKR